MSVLILAGTAEAREVIAKLHKAGMKNVIASLAGATRHPEELPVETRIGGFGGDEAFAEWLEENQIAAVLDATHPFASRVTSRTIKITSENNLSYLRLERPAWVAKPGDDWVLVADASEVNAHIQDNQNVFLATGRQTLADIGQLQADQVFCRQIDPPDKEFPFKNGSYVVGRPPFSVNQEVELFRKLSIDVLVTKNAGGDASATKLDAARELKIPVIMIERPKLSECEMVDNIREATEWVMKHACH